MKYKIDTLLTKYNAKEAIKYLFETENLTHQAIIIHQLNNFINDADVLIILRDYIYKNSYKIKKYSNSLDTCGTGGDGLKTLNISTTVALLLSSVDVPIAKHGNRAASSDSGSSDIIGKLNIKSEKNEFRLHQNMKKNKFTYLNAPLFYPDLAKVAQVRKLIQTKTIFNYMGPTLNPLGAKYQILGTINKSSAQIMTKILSRINLKSFSVFYSHDGLDEISLFSPTTFYTKNNKKINKKTVSHKFYNKYLNKIPNFKDIKGKLPEYNANRLIELFSGKKDTYRDMVIINSIYAMMIFKSKLKFNDCFEILTHSIDRGHALNHLEKLRK
jgi:anthranilate phosphoribosyltransferase